MSTEPPVEIEADTGDEDEQEQPAEQETEQADTQAEAGQDTSEDCAEAIVLTEVDDMPMPELAGEIIDLPDEPTVERTEWHIDGGGKGKKKNG